MNKKKIGQAAQDVLRKAADTIDARATERGEVQERSMARTVAMFNAHWDTNLTEQQGWSFMQHLKAARNRSGHRDDDLLDKTAYAALEAECVFQSNNQTEDTTHLKKPSGIQSSYNLASLREGVWLFNKATDYVCCIEASNTSEAHPSYTILARSYDDEGNAMYVSNYTFRDLKSFKHSFYVLVSTEVHAANNVAKKIIKYEEGLVNV